MSRVCRTCGQEKPATDFYQSQPRKCKVCHCAAVKARARANPSVQAYDRDRGKLPKRRATNRQTVVRWRQQNPQAYRAQTAVGNALRDGKLIKQPCAVCGEPNVHAHHADYAKPLEVEWLCALHHHRRHADDPAAEGKNKKDAV